MKINGMLFKLEQMEQYIKNLEKRNVELLEQCDQISTRRNELVEMYEKLRVENQKLNKKGE